MDALAAIDTNFKEDMNMYQTTEYTRNFWDAMRGKESSYNNINNGRHSMTGAYRLPKKANEQFEAARQTENVFRIIGTVVEAPKHDNTVVTFDTDDMATWIGGKQPNYLDSADEFIRYAIGCHQLGTMIRLSEDFTADTGFDVESYLMQSFARRVGRSEEQTFISGDSVDKPTGILHDAEIGHSAAALTYDDVMKLYFSLDKEYRRNGIWLMSDETALQIRTLKDDAGNLLWNAQENTLMGKPVAISEYMPTAEAGTKPIAFGDFSYFWIVDRVPFMMRTLSEKFALNQQLAYLGYEYLDAKLIRPDAVKTLEIK